ncbi:MAG: mechanosensitive ion channel family protein [Phycisphaerales bacterium]
MQDTANTTQVASTADTVANNGDGITQTINTVGNSFEAFVRDPTVENAVAIFGPMMLSLGQAIVALAILLFIAAFVGRWAGRFTRAGLERLKLEKTIVNFLARTARYAVWIIVIPIAFEIFGIKTTSLAAVIGAAGLAIGLAMQGSLSNIAGGVMLLFLRPIKVGDMVEIADEFGIVNDVGIFYTELYTLQNKLVLLPNSDVLANKIENITASPEYRVDVPIGVAYGTDLPRAMEVLTGVARELGKDFKGHTNDAILKEFGDSSINFMVRVWCDGRDMVAVQSRTVLAIDKALKKAGIEIPFPQRDLHVREPITIITEPKRDA